VRWQDDRYTLAQALVSIEHRLTLDAKVILRDVNAEIRDIERADSRKANVCFLGHQELGNTAQPDHRRT